MKFNTQYDRNITCYETGDDTLIVERAGYVPPKKQVENMLYSGQRLVAFRKEEFDGETVEEALENADPTREPDFDLADVGGLMRDLEERSAKRAAESKADDKSGSTDLSVEKTGEEA